MSRHSEAIDFLTVCTPDGAHLRRDLDEPVVNIGRSSGNEIVLTGNGISRSHAAIAKHPGGLLLSDCNSRNGTFVNDNRVGEPVTLGSGDRIRIGDHLLVVNALEPSPVTFTGEDLRHGPGTHFLSTEEIGASLRGSDTPPPSPRVAAILLEAERKIAVSRPLAEILENLLDLAHRVASYERGLILQFRGGRTIREAVRLPNLASDRSFPVSRAIIDHVRRTGESVLTSDAISGKEWKESTSIQEQHIRSVMCVPFMNEGDVVGVIYLDNRQKAGLFSLGDLHVLTFLADIAAVKIENARLFEDAVERRRRDHEFTEAASIQTRLLPDRAPVLPGYALDAATYPCHEVGGDFYDYIELPGGRIGIAVGDVAGKGIPGALLMSNFLACLRSCSELDPPVDLLINRLNKLACRSCPIDRFVTFFFGIIDPEHHSLTWSNAGHCAPYLVRSGAPGVRLQAGGLPLGILPEHAYRSSVIPLEPGDTLFCFSDGVTDARNEGGEEFEEERLELAFAGPNGATPRQFIERIVGAIDAHCGTRPHEDDLTMLVVHRKRNAVR
jgi:serine phosphatase RsbU (regulator of sigma subunit)